MEYKLILPLLKNDNFSRKKLAFSSRNYLFYLLDGVTNTFQWHAAFQTAYRVKDSGYTVVVVNEKQSDQAFSIAPKDGAESALYSKMFTGPFDIYEVKRSQHHLLAVTETNRLGAPIKACRMLARKDNNT